MVEMMEIMELKERDIYEDVVIIGGLIGVQFVYAGNSVLLSYLMSTGIRPLTIVIFSAFSTFLIISPVATYFERSRWPKKFSFNLITQLLLISFGGVTLFQTLFLKGIKLTSAATATAMPNLAPGFIFVIAWTFRLEKVKLSCVYSKVKIIGTLLCVVGALTMSIMHSTGVTAREAELKHPFPDIAFDTQKIIGCLYLIAAVLALSSNVVLQAKTLSDFPAPMSLCAITSLMGMVMTAVVQLIQDHRIDIGWPLVNIRDLIAFSLLGGFLSGVCVSFNGWAMKKRGPVFVSTFSPISTVCSVILSMATLGDTINIGSLIGMFLMFTGLYFVLWAKGKEGYYAAYDIESEFNAEKPLLS
ncbi:WAT1-related protein At5g47470-like [Carya illinoinensis]|uniref:WAT1-related protein n=1 Tax=Carya illinoinensis TaxID=32201 RepID=A0A8T1NTQ3_CARIL|nr:WAT1-related protein At5g47470-like [Carya illinoinensis]KAG6633498.1 hypothetical protein CIPAW_12G051900 [Carya illinoinensis]